jgi:NAD(P)-dependent dehydrogenase (short-subunit alcohol dehydrogenase family)
MSVDSTQQGVCLVTGAARGIGAATALRAARAGYAVVVNCRRADAAATAVADQIRADGGRALVMAADVSDPDQVRGMFEGIERDLGPVTALVNNAGISGGREKFTDIGIATLRRVVDVNLIGTVLCSQMAARRMMRSAGGAGGAIVNVSSQAVRTGGRNLAAYVASKAAVEGLTLALARELAAEGIRVNAVSPGIIATGQQPLDDPAWQASATARIPLGRIGGAEEVADTILWLLGPESSYVTGVVVPVAGGR